MTAHTDCRFPDCPDCTALRGCGPDPLPALYQPVAGQLDILDALQDET